MNILHITGPLCYGIIKQRFFKSLWYIFSSKVSSFKFINIIFGQPSSFNNMLWSIWSIHKATFMSVSTWRYLFGYLGSWAKHHISITCLGNEKVQRQTRCLLTEWSRRIYLRAHLRDITSLWNSATLVHSWTTTTVFRIAYSVCCSIYRVAQKNRTLCFCPYLC